MSIEEKITSKPGEIQKHQKEIKINIHHTKVDEIVNSFLKRHDIDYKVDIYLTEVFDNCVNFDEVYKNSKLRTQKKYNHQFDNNIFMDFHYYLNSIINDAIRLDLDIRKYDEYTPEYHEDLIKVLDNLCVKLPLTMYPDYDGLDKLKITTLHYFLKIIERYADAIILEYDIKKVRGFKIPLELFRYEMINIISNNIGLNNFVATLKSLIEQWLIKYNHKSKIGMFYHQIMMVSPEYIVEKILRFVILTTIKNKNPMTLRAIFSSYITIIHTNIYSFYSTNMTKQKVGNFKQTENLFDESFINEHEHIKYKQNPVEMVLDSTIKAYMLTHKICLKDNYGFLADDYTNSFLGINYIDFMSAYTKDINVMDNFYIYNKYLKYTKNGFRKQNYRMSINREYTKNAPKKLIDEILINKFMESYGGYFKNLLGSDDEILIVIKTIVQGLIQNINPKSILTPSFEKIMYTNDEYINDLEQMVFTMNKLLDDKTPNLTNN